MRGGKQAWSCPEAFPAVAVPVELLDVGAVQRHKEPVLASPPHLSHLNIQRLFIFA